MKFYVIKGAVKTLNPDGKSSKWVGYGETVEMSEAEAKHVDPDGLRLASESKFKTMQEKKALEKRMAEAEKAEQSKGAK